MTISITEYFGCVGKIKTSEKKEDLAEEIWRITKLSNNNQST